MVYVPFATQERTGTPGGKGHGALYLPRSGRRNRRLENVETNVHGRFRCDNNACDSRGWSSGAVATVIREYPDHKYNARLYHQRYQKCDQLSRPELTDDSYAVRVSNRLKIWAGHKVEKPVISGNSELPHNRELCEGCKAGVCKIGRRVVREEDREA